MLMSKTEVNEICYTTTNRKQRQRQVNSDEHYCLKCSKNAEQNPGRTQAQKQKF